MFRFKSASRGTSILHLRTAGLEPATARAFLQAHAEALPSNALIEITLPGRLCPMLMLPWTQAMLGTAIARSNYARERFATIYGVRAQEWLVAADDAPFGCPRLAYAAPAALIEALRTDSAQLGLRIAAIRPRMVAEIQTAKHSNGLIAVAEEDYVSVCMIEKGRVVLAHGVPWSAQNGDSVDVICARFMLRHPQFASARQAIVLRKADYEN